ncbi:regulatory protein, lacI family [Friedmanniella luteola]|uniref:Regulatory protein, lacI family n=1 Tax=Friedmanniella luteola TaxID=546871 RepID=A0A1H1ZDJ7_9ACTN|nr:LacI family DNA-binding transcriptional regulator [Friedmanniella luteola]SDT31740.1 regulatory protein, lacI family [Friedmanniella luteola]
MSTLVEVAGAAGVSTRTVVNVLAGHPHVRAETRRRVLAAVEELGYRPDPVARTLRRGSPDALVLLVPDRGYDGLAQRLVEAAVAAGCRTVLDAAELTDDQPCLLVVRPSGPSRA